jgi:hypothetical protein
LHLSIIVIHGMHLELLKKDKHNNLDL